MHNWGEITPIKWNHNPYSSTLRDPLGPSLNCGNLKNAQPLLRKYFSPDSQVDLRVLVLTDGFLAMMCEYVYTHVYRIHTHIYNYIYIYTYIHMHAIQLLLLLLCYDYISLWGGPKFTIHHCGSFPMQFQHDS